MGETTAIGWTDHTFNPWWGCVKISPACDSCYAERDAHRWGYSDEGSEPELWGPASDRRMLSDGHWRKPLGWDRAAAAAGRPALVFCASMADVFEARSDLDAPRARLFELIEQTPNLIWQLLTKRPEQVLWRIPPSWLGLEAEGPERYVQLDPQRRVPWGYVTTAERVKLAARPEAFEAWPSNVWIGTTVEDQQRAELRIPRLLQIPAPVRFLSCEPLLGSLDLRPWLPESANGELRPDCPLGWIIIGGESGPGFRAMEPEHALWLAAQAQAARVPTYFKQVSGQRSGIPAGDEELDGLKAWPSQAGERGAPVEIR